MGGAGPIPWWAIDQYSRDWDPVEADELRRLIRVLDDEFLSDMANERKKKKAKKRANK